MKKRRRKKRSYLSKVISTSVAIACIVLSGLITANDTLDIPYLPTWQELFSRLGFRESVELPDSQLRMTVLDVGNADCILLQNQGKFAMIDAGERGDGDDIVAYLRRLGVTRLDYLIATHPDSDHIGGMPAVIEEMEIGTFLMSFMPEGHEPTTVTYENLLQALVDKDIMPTEPTHGAAYTFGDATIDILSGLSEYTETNEQSIVCRVCFGTNRFLLMGDAGVEVEKELMGARYDLKADVLKVGHHGSRSSSSETFIRRVSPAHAIITCGLDNSYNHPHAETLDTLEKCGVSVYRSDIHGVITIVSDGTTVTVSTET